MALYLAEAVLDHGPGPLDEEAFGRAVGEAFCRWLDDPLMPLTAPGHTCIAGARNWRRTRDWRTSGVAGSDGCGAVMRVVPLGIAFAGADLDRAAAVSARLTHGHPNAAASAVATCRLLRATLERGRFDSALVAEITAGLPESGVVVDALLAALAQADAPRDGWLDERAIPPGDGGWRSPSALGLAVAAAQRWGRDFETAVGKAARIDGDSDSVAALTGMFLGAESVGNDPPRAAPGSAASGARSDEESTLRRRSTTRSDEAPRSGSPRPGGLSAPARESVPLAEHPFSGAGADNEAARDCCSRSEGGTAVLPATWLAAVKDRDRIEDLARRVAARGAPPAPR